MNISVSTPKGDVEIEGPVSGEEILKLKMNPGLELFRPPLNQQMALAEIAKMPEGMVYIARHGDEIAGYVTFHRPVEFTRWYSHPRVLELGAIEIGPDWRRCGLAEALLKAAFSNELLESYIVIAIEFCWHWDVNNTGLDLLAYQKMLIKLFGKVGFKKIVTDDPDITEHPLNMLMVRYGRKVQICDIKRFKNLVLADTFGSVDIACDQEQFCI